MTVVKVGLCSSAVNYQHAQIFDVARKHWIPPSPKYLLIFRTEI